MKTLAQYMEKLPNRFDEESVRKLVKIILDDAASDIESAKQDAYDEGYRDGWEVAQRDKD
jgi:flagellar biosynthesis/type III secretory pathway protein FliH